MLCLFSNVGQRRVFYHRIKGSLRLENFFQRNVIIGNQEKRFTQPILVDREVFVKIVECFYGLYVLALVKLNLCHQVLCLRTILVLCGIQGF